MGKDRRQKASPFAVAELRPNPRLSLRVWDCKPVEEILFKAVKPLLTINQNLAVFGQCPASDLWLVPVIREVAPQIPT